MFVTSGKASLAYDVGGSPGDGADVLLIHAGVTDRRSWRPLLESLDSRRRYVSYDMRGYGETRYEPEDHFAYDDALAVMDEVGLGRAVVVGSSTGGRAALDLTLEHAGRVAALVLIGPAISGEPQTGDDPEPIASMAVQLKAAEEAGDLDEVNRLEAHLWLDGPTATEGRVSGATRELFLEMNGRALAAADPGDEPGPVDAWNRLEELAVPVLVLVGTLDLPDFQEHSRMLADRVPSARLVVLDGVAHLPHVEADPVCLREIAGFLEISPSPYRPVPRP
ncbi:MAG: alpha/beta hydrolase [Nocardioidaceae bacterium]